MRLHVVGNICLDTTFGLSHLPQPGETVNGRLTAEGLGGKGANQAVAAARVGADVRLHAAIGSDAVADQLIGTLVQDLSAQYLTRTELASDRSTILVDQAGENVVISAVGCAAAFDPREILVPQLRAGDTLLMQGNLSREVTQACLTQAKRCGLYTIFNPSPLGPQTAVDFSSVDLLIANRTEATALAATPDMAEAIAKLVQLGAASVIVTLGADGCLVQQMAEDAPLHIPGLTVTARDTSGAGDCFAGTVAGLLSLGKPLTPAIAVAMEAAALAVCRHGTVASFPSRAEMASLLTTFELERP
jgi:ribokinase